MLYTSFSEINAERIGIIRVYDNDNTVPPAPYIAFHVVLINGDECEVQGNISVSIKEYMATCRQLAALGLKTLNYTNKGKLVKVDLTKKKYKEK